MKVRTQNSLYEIELARKRFRRLAGTVSASAPPLDQWQAFGQISPVRVGEPIRIYWLKSKDGPLARIGIWTTARVVEIVDAGAGAEHVDATTQPIVEPEETGDAEPRGRTSH